MSASGHELAADLSQLWGVGKVDMPQIAYLYTKLNRDLAGTASGDADAFGGGFAPKGMGGSAGDLYQKWSALRDRLQDAFGNTALGAEAAGQALVAIADRYSATDTDAATELSATWRDGPPAGTVRDGDEPLSGPLPPPILSH
jgi:hypothetical protein